MSYVTLKGTDPGIASAWIAATVGMKTNRTLKNKISDVHIPKVCEAVTVLATKENHLRLTSNLLYGLSLIFKQKVTVMESEVLDVNFRLQTPLFGGVKETKQAQVSSSTQRIAKLTDDVGFNIETDFLPEFREASVSQSVATLEELLVTNFGNQAQEVADTVHGGDKDMTTDFANETNIAVDFEFDFMGNIIDPDENSRPLLELLNTEEDFSASKPTIDDISKSLNSMSYDQHHTTTLDVVRSKVATIRPTKKRKVRILLDDVTTFSPQPMDKVSPKSLKTKGFQDIYRYVSVHQPSFLNTNREILFPAIPSVQQCFLDEARQRNMALYGDVEIERGRNLQSHRRSSSVFELIGHDFNFEDLDLNFLTEAAATPSQPVEGNGPSQDLDSQNSKKLEDFAKYLRERMTDVSTNHPEISEYSFEELLPSKPGRDVPVSRKVAANSFAYMLQLASMGELQISSETMEHREEREMAEREMAERAMNREEREMNREEREMNKKALLLPSAPEEVYVRFL